MKILHVHCSSSFISKDQFSLLSTLQGQPQLLLEYSHVYCKWCVNFFILANRRIQALLCHFTPCAGQIPIHVIAFHSSLFLCGFPHPSPPCLPQQWGYIALCHEAAIRLALRWLLCAREFLKVALMPVAFRSKSSYRWKCLWLLPPST